MDSAEQGHATPEARAGLIGIDVGAATIQIVWRAASGAELHRASAPAQGPPSAALARLLRQLPFAPATPDLPIRIAVTGNGQVFAHLFPCLLVNEVMATAGGVCDACPSARTILDLGGQFSKWILLGAGPTRPGAVVDFTTNGLCAAGAGAFMEQQASRLGMRVDALGRLADTAARAASIAGRCSVFAKSDMIHLQQKGTPPEEIAYGLWRPSSSRSTRAGAGRRRSGNRGNTRVSALVPGAWCLAGALCLVVGAQSTDGWPPCGHRR